MPAIPHILFDLEGEYHVTAGDLIKIPAEFFSKTQIEFYRRATSGWSICPLGYNFYSGKDALGRTMIFPGVIFPGVDRKGRRKFPNYPLRFKKEEIEKYIRPHIERSKDLRVERDTLYRNLTHDLRAISTEIYNQALVARDGVRKQRNATLSKNLDRVLAAQQMMSVRLDIIDYESGLYSAKSNKSIKVFKKVEKVFLCFSHKMSKKRMRTTLDGTSFSDVFGPDILEIVVFVLIENAIKYAPIGSELNVTVADHGDSVEFKVASLGPCIAGKEQSKIFDRGFRGAAAERLTKASGSGIGLFAAKSIVEGQFHGEIGFTQDTKRTFIDGANFYPTVFFVRLPIRRKVEKKAFRRRKLFR